MPATRRPWSASAIQWLHEHDKPIENVVEVGCFTGQTTEILAKAFPDATIFAVDHFQGNPSDHTSMLVKLAGGPHNLRKEFDERLRQAGVSLLPRRPPTSS